MDYAGINIFTGADGGVMASSGYFLSELMTDEELADLGGNNVLDTWMESGTTNYYEDWWEADLDDPDTFPPFHDSMVAYTVTGGHAQVSVMEDTVVLADNIPSLIMVPMGKAGFYGQPPGFDNFWWEVRGETAWKMEYLMQRTDTVTSVKYDYGTGIVRDFAPGDTSTVGLWAYDQDDNPIAGYEIDGWVQVYGANAMFKITSGGVTDASGRTSATVLGYTHDQSVYPEKGPLGNPHQKAGEFTYENPLSNPAKQPMYMQVSAANAAEEAQYGWHVFTSVEIFNVPVQLYLSVEATPIIQEEGETATESEILITVVDEFGDAMEEFFVEFSNEGGSLSAINGTTDSEGK
ncbi:MAG: Ig-like domain-containing protein, partial [Thermoplasmata archaeon]|nr:Ig-like domain-containing protein [Thermoplasmata archaeon]